MTAYAPFAVPPRGIRAIDRAALALLGVALAAVALRLGQFGNPLAGLDEQFYLLAGDRMWRGDLPYVDIWDRKPAGLFLIYAVIRALPGDGILAYQLVATVCLAATGMVAVHLTHAVLPPRAALCAGLSIVVYGIVLGTGFGEAPIFYDLLTILAGALVIALRERPGGRGIDPRAVAAMLLCGLSLTVKTSAVFESCCFGALLLDADRRRLPLAALGLRAAAYLAIGLAPTLAIAAFYALHGDWQAFAFANFRSAFLRGSGATQDSAGRLVAMLVLLSPLIVPTLVEWRHIPRERRMVLTAWLAAGLLSFVAIGRFYEHYALPLVTPLALTAAYGFRRLWVAALPIALAGLMIAGNLSHWGEARRQDASDVAALAAALPAGVKSGCLFVYEGPTILYHLTGACLSGRYVFPGHFTEPEEEGALERPMADILRSALAHRPLAVVSVPELREGKVATDNDRILAAELARAYRPVAKQNIRLYGAHRVDAVVWQRR